MTPSNAVNPPITTTLICLAQNRLGALDRVLGILTARGYVSQRLSATITGPERLQIMITLTVEDEKALEKLIKALYKQIYVIEIQMIMAQDENPKPENVVNFPEARIPATTTTMAASRTL
jgi:acetolactate synthase small subunit